MRQVILFALRFLALALALLGGQSTAFADYASAVVMSNLHNPRGLAIGTDGGIYVTEAGFLVPGGPTTTIGTNTLTYSTTGSVSRYLGGTQTRIVSGLASVFSTANGVSGPQGIAFDPGGNAYVAVGLGADPNVRTAGLAPLGINLGQVVRLAPSPSNFSDIAGFEAANNPAGGPLDSNPFHLAFAGPNLLVTDAGGNSLLAVNPTGSVALLATFPPRAIGGPGPSDPVPTGVAVGPDGAFYVAELTGFPFTPGAARIYRVPAGGGAPTVYLDGFTNITDLAFGPDGSLYVLEYDANGLLVPGSDGALIRVAPDGTRTTLLSAGLTNATGLALGRNGDFYVSINSNSPDAGAVVRLAPVPEPGSFALVAVGLVALLAAKRRRPAR